MAPLFLQGKAGEGGQRGAGASYGSALEEEEQGQNQASCMS